VVTVADDVTVPALATVSDVDILAAGTWKLSTGEATFTTDDLAHAVEASQCPAVGAPVLKLGYIDPRFDGEPAVGRVANMSLNTSGNKITGDLAGMPGWLGEVISSAYPNRSVEGTWDFICQIGHTHPFVITALALLGVAAPGVGVLGSLEDVGSLFGVSASAGNGRTWITEGGPRMAGQVMAAGVTTEDVRRAYYASPQVGYSMWITEMQMDPPQLIVADEATNKVYRVPLSIDNGEVMFGEAVEVAVEYVDVPEPVAASGRGKRLTYASREESRKGVRAADSWDGGQAQKNLGDDPTSAQLKALYALPADTKSDSKLPHHEVSTDGKVGAANTTACSSAIAAINGGRGGIKGIGAADLKSAYNHLAKHLTDAGQEAPDYSGPSASGSGGHGVLGSTDEPLTHSHPHSSFGSQGGDKTHTHEHTHAGDGSHAHAHGDATAGRTGKGGTDVEFTDEQNTSLRASLGLDDDEELTPEVIANGAQMLRQRVDAKGSARASLPPGTMTVDREAWDALQRKVQAGENFRAESMRNQRDEVIGEAIRQGKFSASRRPHWQRLWDKDPEGTREVLASLQKNVVPVDDIGSPGGSDEELLDSEYRSLFPPGSTGAETQHAG